MQVVFPDVGSGWKLPGEEAIAVDQVTKAFGWQRRIGVRTSGVALPMGPGEVPGINEVIDRITFLHQGGAEVSLIAGKKFLEFGSVIIPGDHLGGGAVEQPPLRVKAPAFFGDFGSRACPVLPKFARFSPVFEAEAAPSIVLESEENPGEWLDGKTGLGEKNEVGVVFIFQGFVQKVERCPDEGDVPPVRRNKN